MRKVLCVLVVMVLLGAAAGFAESDAPVELEGDWFVATLYTGQSYPLTRRPESAANLSSIFLMLADRKAPELLPLGDEAVLVYERRASGVPGLALADKDGFMWRCRYSFGSGRITFAGGKVIEPTSGQAADYAFDGGRLRMTYGGEALDGEVIRYGEDAFELRYTEEAFESYISYGVPSLLFVRADALATGFSLEGDWFGEVLYPLGNRVDLPAWFCALLEKVSDGSALGGSDRLTVGNQVFTRLGDGLAVGCTFEGGMPTTMLLMRREENGGWSAYENRFIDGYRFQDGLFTELGRAGWWVYDVSGDTLTIFQQSENLIGDIVVHGEDAFEWRFQDQDYIENGTNFGVPWMLFVRQSVAQ